MIWRFLITLFVIWTLPSRADAQPAQVRVVWAEDPAHEAIVSWTTKNAEPGEVFWDSDAHPLAAEYATSAMSRPAKVDDEPHVVHHASLAGLQPNSIVHFRVVADGGPSRDFWFKTAPADATPFALLYGGDSRSDSKARRAMNARMADLVRDDPSIIALAHGGDYIASGSSWPQWYRWLEDWQHTISEDGRVLPIIPARGNHEGDGDLFNVVFGFPGPADGSGEWYVSRIGQDFALITLDSNESQGGEQRQWLDATLRTLQDTRWIAANYHRPAYPAVKSPGGALSHWVPLFEQYNVDFVLESDGHVLKRTMPIRADQPDPTGVVYLGEGGLGVPQRTPDLSRWYLKPPGMAMSSHHVQLLRITRDKVFYSAVDLEGEVIDRYEFTPKRLGHAGEAPATIQALPVGKAPPPPAPSILQCATTRGRAPAGLVVLFVLGLLFGRRRFVAICLLLAATGCGDYPCTNEFAPTGPARIHAIGDSVLWWNSSMCMSVPDLVGQHQQTAVKNSAATGARVTTVDRPIRDQYVSNDWDWVLISGGGNDLNGCGCEDGCDKELRTLAASDGTAGEMENLVDTALDDGARVILFGSYQVGPTALYGFHRCNGIFEELGERYLQLANAHDQVFFVDTSEVISPDSRISYDFDFVHPSAHGSGLIAAQVAATMSDAE